MDAHLTSSISGIWQYVPPLLSKAEETKVLLGMATSPGSGPLLTVGMYKGGSFRGGIGAGWPRMRGGFAQE
jgi:hypothetical protein